MASALITSVPFGDRNPSPLKRLEQAGIDYRINPYSRRLTELELTNLIQGHDIVIAGTEPITEKVIGKAPSLKLISRVGIGLDSVDLLAASQRGIKVTYTPDAPAAAVSELTIALILSLLRSVNSSNLEMHQGVWHRHFGRRMSEVTYGIIGIGRIGSRVIEHLRSFGDPPIMANDIDATDKTNRWKNVAWVSKEDIYKEADVLSLHLPLTQATNNLIGREQLLMMKRDALIVNTSRGGIVKESDLYEVLQTGHLGGAAIDVFCEEPYSGPLASLERCLLTAHMGSMSFDCRIRMEIEAVEDAVRFVMGKSLKREVPTEEYEAQRLELI